MDEPRWEPAAPPAPPLRRALRWLEATPAELAGLVVLLAGSVAAAGVIWWTSTPRPLATPADLPGAQPVGSPAPAAVTSPVPAEVTVHVAGAVASPGVVRLPGGSRVDEAIAAAGGALADADLSAVNLARTLTDGEQVVVPVIGAPAPAPTASSTRSAAWTVDGRLDLNRATAADLDELPGIGPVLAERIVTWRTANGPFRDVGQLREVSGIGERTFQDLAELVTVA